MDKRKYNGGPREGAGRKTKADEIKVIEAMDAVLAPAEVWKALADKVKDGDGHCIKTWLSYRYGMPLQRQENDVKIMEPEFHYTKEERDKRIKELMLKHQESQSQN